MKIILESRIYLQDFTLLNFSPITINFRGISYGAVARCVRGGVSLYSVHFIELSLINTQLIWNSIGRNINLR